ncbi:hypothetical protein BS78_04G198500 [Paspalum vaginatum]|nr:hypothetical protein BS78_04G198500 [Paspalum vaginatum]
MGWPSAHGASPNARHSRLSRYLAVASHISFVSLEIVVGSLSILVLELELFVADDEFIMPTKELLCCNAKQRLFLAICLLSNWSLEAWI